MEFVFRTDAVDRFYRPAGEPVDDGAGVEERESVDIATDETRTPLVEIGGSDSEPVEETDDGEEVPYVIAGPFTPLGHSAPPAPAEEPAAPSGVSSGPPPPPPTPTPFVAGLKKKPEDLPDKKPAVESNTAAQDLAKKAEEIAREARGAAMVAGDEARTVRELFNRVDQLLRYFIIKDQFLSVQGSYLAWKTLFLEYMISAVRGQPARRDLVQNAQNAIKSLKPKVDLLHKQANEAYHQIQSLLGEPSPATASPRVEPQGAPI